MTIAFLQAVVGSVDKLIYDPVTSKSAEEMQKAVEKDIDLAGWCKKLAGDNKAGQGFFNDFSLSGVIKAAYDEMNNR